MAVIEDDIIAGNLYDKYGTSNPIAAYLMEGFKESFEYFVTKSGAKDIHEIGCGEGKLSIAMAGKGLCVRASDFSREIIKKAEENAKQSKLEIHFRTGNIYEMIPARDSAELIVCCEVMEHLADPRAALEIVERLAKPYFLVSVPREPLWRWMNLARFKYVSRFGNTPGHIQHWSSRAFLDFLRTRFDIIEKRLPIPWTMALCRIRNVRQNRWS